MIRVRDHGFTLIELLTAAALLTLFIALSTAEILHLTNASRAVARSSGELLAATRFAEHFRNDVRQARSALVRPGAQSVVLYVGDSKIEYRINADARLERAVAATGDISTGPYVESVTFELNDQEASSRTLLHARWDCLAETDPAQDKNDPARPRPRVLILDTALRSEKSAEAKR